MDSRAKDNPMELSLPASISGTWTMPAPRSAPSPGSPAQLPRPTRTRAAFAHIRGREKLMFPPVRVLAVAAGTMSHPEHACAGSSGQTVPSSRPTLCDKGLPPQQPRARVSGFGTAPPAAQRLHFMSYVYFILAEKQKKFPTQERSTGSLKTRTLSFSSEPWARQHRGDLLPPAPTKLFHWALVLSYLLPPMDLANSNPFQFESHPLCLLYPKTRAPWAEGMCFKGGLRSSCGGLS